MSAKMTGIAKSATGKPGMSGMRVRGMRKAVLRISSCQNERPTENPYESRNRYYGKINVAINNTAAASANNPVTTAAGIK